MGKEYTFSLMDRTTRGSLKLIRQMMRMVSTDLRDLCTLVPSSIIASMVREQKLA